MSKTRTVVCRFLSEWTKIIINNNNNKNTFQVRIKSKVAEIVYDNEEEHFSLLNVREGVFYVVYIQFVVWCVNVCLCVCSWSDKGDELSQVSCLFHQWRSDRFPGSYG